MATARLGLSTLSENQAGAEITANESLYVLDAICQAGAIDRIYAAPASPTHGDVYLIHGGTPAGGNAWENHENKIAYYQTNTWKFISPKAGMIVYVMEASEKVWWFYDGSAWKVGPLKTDSISGHIITPTAQDLVVDLRASGPYEITELSGITSAGTCTIRLKKNGSAIGADVSVSSTIAISTTNLPVAVAVNDKIELTVSAISSADNLAFGVKINLG